MKRFVDNCREAPSNRKCGPLTTSEITSQRKWWIVRAQRDGTGSDEFKCDQVNLNLKPNNDGILECHGRIEGEFPIYLPRNHPFTRKLVERAHLMTLHGGVAMTMAKVRESYWISKLRQASQASSI